MCRLCSYDLYLFLLCYSYNNSTPSLFLQHHCERPNCYTTSAMWVTELLHYISNVGGRVAMSTISAKWEADLQQCISNARGLYYYTISSMREAQFLDSNNMHPLSWSPHRVSKTSLCMRVEETVCSLQLHNVMLGIYVIMMHVLNNKCALCYY